MIIVAHEHPGDYWEAAESFLLQKEAENCLAIGIARTLVRQPGRYPKHHLFTVQGAGRIVGAGWMTPPHPLGLTDLPADALSLVVEHARSLADTVTALVAPKPTAVAFKDAWLQAVGCAVKSHVAQRIFQLTTVVHRPRVDGTFRKATESDRDLLEAWHQAFLADCNLTGDGIEACRQGIRSGCRYVWEVGRELVAMVGFGGETPSGVRISWVYTPPAHRRRGYATALVAAMSQKLLDEGRRFCFLYTDLANPTSNHIYQDIGYRPVCDSMHFTFSS